MKWDVFKGCCQIALSVVLFAVAFILLLGECDGLFLFIMAKIVGVICAVLAYRLSPLYGIGKDDNDER